MKNLNRQMEILKNMQSKVQYLITVQENEEFKTSEQMIQLSRDIATLNKGLAKTFIQLNNDIELELGSQVFDIWMSEGEE